MGGRLHFRRRAASCRAAAPAPAPVAAEAVQGSELVPGAAASSAPAPADAPQQNAPSASALTSGQRQTAALSRGRRLPLRSPLTPLSKTLRLRPRRPAVNNRPRRSSRSLAGCRNPGQCSPRASSKRCTRRSRTRATSSSSSPRTTNSRFTSFEAERLRDERERHIVVLRCDDAPLRGLLADSVYQTLVGVADPEERKSRILAAAERRSSVESSLCEKPDGQEEARELRKRRPKPHSIWHLDEVYLKIDGRMV